MEESACYLKNDPSRMSLKEKLDLFEGKNELKGILQPTLQPNLFSPNILLKKNESSSSKDHSSPNCYPRKQSTSTTDNNVPSSQNMSSSIENSKSTPSTGSSSANQTNQKLLRSQHSIAKKLSKVSFLKSSHEIINENHLMKLPEVLEVFSDLDLFIERELDEIEIQKRIQQKMSEQMQMDQVSAAFKKLKEEYEQDKQKHQDEFEEQIKHHRKDDRKFEIIPEEDENEQETDDSSLDLSNLSRMNQFRSQKIEKLKQESVKQEYLLSKINRALENVINVDERNLVMVMNLERHYLVATSRFQAALTELRILNDPSEPFHPPPFHRKGKCVVSEIMLEVKPSYFECQGKLENEFIVVVLKYDDQVFASKAVVITDDILVLKFPHKFRVDEAYVDFDMRFEVHGTTFWRDRNSIRKTMLKKYGFVNFTLADTGVRRKRLEMIEVIKGEQNPLRKKVLMKIKQKITADVLCDGILMMKFGNHWVKTFSKLNGNLLEINFIEDQSSESIMILDLYNYDSDFVISNVSSVSRKPFSFLLKFNHYVSLNDFHLLLAALSASEYAKWVNSINKALVLIK